eukprot:CAMPEP_0175117202 /NCGR_PEP_ID=MMETSP0086_2-20121207/18717_1 /TAXON_ID=136419 /ORGANISM="Unknown Unknown, Strain D1" /LENGTH=151 /DNA_ID=CAMNT_0016397809 /DNA_START=391 /DNA_END=846 /DNA_ORIENTATION=+
MKDPTRGVPIMSHTFSSFSANKPITSATPAKLPYSAASDSSTFGARALKASHKHTPAPAPIKKRASFQILMAKKPVSSPITIATINAANCSSTAKEATKRKPAPHPKKKEKRNSVYLNKRDPRNRNTPPHTMRTIARIVAISTPQQVDRQS